MCKTLLWLVMEIAVTFILLVLAGVCVGMLSGMLGVGGGMVMVPLLRLGFDLSAYAATATSLFAIIPISLAGMVQHVRNRTCIPKLGLVLGIGGAITSSLGVYLASVSPAWLIMLAAALVIIYSAYKMLRKAVKMDGRASEDASRAETEQAPDTLPAISRNQLFAGFGIGLIAGLFSGYIGVGGGFIMVPLMTGWLDIPMKKSSGTSLLAIIILAIPGVIEQMVLGNVVYLMGIMLCVGAIPGAVLGAWLVPRIPERTLRFVFAGMLAVAAVSLVVKELL